MTKSILYARVSSKEQANEGFSIPAQEKLLREYASKEGFQIVKEFVDVETAKRAGREKFGQMKQYIKDHPDVKSLLVEKTDRLYRNLKDYVELEDFDIDIHLVKENQVMSKDSYSDAKFMHGIRVLMAKKYVDNLSEETKKGMTEKAEQGLYPSVAPFGYLNNRIEKTIEVDEGNSETVRQLYEWYSTGEYSLKDLRAKAQEEGFLDGLSKYKMSKSSLEKLLKSVFYFGDFVWNGKQYQGSHKPIVDKGLWETVQDVFKNKTNNCQGKRTKDPFKFSGLMTCSKCGCSITAQRQKGKYVYYRCTNGRGKCDQSFVREEAIEEQFLGVLGKLHFTDEIMDWMREALLLSHKDEADYHQDMIDKLQAKYKSLQTKIDVMYEDKLEGKISEELWQRKYSEYSEKQKESQKSIDLHKSADSSYIDLGLKLMELAKDAVKLYNKLDVKRKRDLLKTLLLNSTLNDGKLVVTYNTPFDVLVDCVKSENWLPGADSNHGPIG